MRIYVHIIAVLLAMTLVSKPCIQVLGSNGLPEPEQTTSASGAVAKAYTPACENECLRARSESFRREVFLATKPADDGSPDNFGYPRVGYAETFTGQQQTRPPDKSFISSSKVRLHALCRLLT